MKKSSRASKSKLKENRRKNFFLITIEKKLSPNNHCRLEENKSQIDESKSIYIIENDVKIKRINLKYDLAQ